MSTQHEISENLKKNIDDQTSSYSDSGFITESCELTGDQSKEISADIKREETDMTVKKTIKTTMTENPKSQSKDSETENYTDSGIVSCSNISSQQQNQQSILITDLEPYVPTYMIRRKIQQPQHHNLQIEKYFEQDEDGYTKLHIAILHNIEPAIQILINCAPNPHYLNIKNYFGQTALHLAVLQQSHTTVHKLINAGADINARDNRCNSPLQLAVLNQDINCVAVILSAIYPDEKKAPIANLEQWNFDGETCFYVACKQRNIPIIKLLAKTGANVNAREGRSGYSPLHLAVETHANEVIKFLCESCIDSIDLDCETYGGLTAFQLSLLTNQEPLAEYLMKKGATPYFMDSDEELEDSDSEEDEKNQL
ncbi:putative Caskin-1 [Polypedilum vanderplanki]|uniref:Caskin-1 n=1 Tax=Polypedilum vanderplanki TaxID=319348 RepID=A0A9J6BV18_POLVA|nr:putative Caskin-1 [Polypedilum vanderplanki]